MAVLGYKQIINHNNKMPTIRTKILDVSTLCRYRDGTSNNKPDRYYFDITTNGVGLNSAYKHSCYFDNKNEAKKNYKETCLKFYDQLTSPFLQKVKSGHSLTMKDKEKISKIVDKIDVYKKIDEVILRK